MRLDDACEKRDIARWDAVEVLLDRYGIKPLVGVIPHCEDPEMAQYLEDESFWERVKSWQEKGWSIALHGYNHVYNTACGGINPVNARSEFAGEPLEVQQEKIRKGVAVFREHGIDPEAFFAPSHTFDENTLEALRTESNIRIISDTVAGKPYRRGDFTFVPQQSGAVRKLPFPLTTFCYHPNTLNDAGLARLEVFLAENSKQFVAFPAKQTDRKAGWWDKFLQKLYFAMRSVRTKV